MSSIPSQIDLHLPDLSVKGFRGIKDLTISRLGRVTLFAGKNGVGKTTLLDAVRLYAARGRLDVLVDILRDREEFADTVDVGISEELTNWEALFYGRHPSPEACISIGPTRENQSLSVLKIFTPNHHVDRGVQSIKTECLRDDKSESLSEIRCQSLGPGLLSNAHLAESWDKVALTDDETRAVEALNLIFNHKIDRVAVIGDERRGHYARRVVVKVAGQDRPVSLKSLGDGAARLFGVALALANSQGGFLLIDEAENGIHHSIQSDFWKMVLKTAHMNNVQVLATTHGWDCVVGFARAATDLDEVEGILVRLEQDGERIRAIEYSEDDLNIAAEQGIEVR